MPEPLFTFADLVARVCPALEGINTWKVVRHLNNSPGVPDLVELFHLGGEALEFYRAEQGRDIFGACYGIFTAGAPREARWSRSALSASASARGA